MVTHLELDILECEVSRALGSIAMSKVTGSDRILAELFKIIKEDAVKVLNSIRQKIWKTHQWPQDWKRSVFHSNLKERQCQECSNYCTVGLISHDSKFSSVTQLCPTLCNPVDCSTPGLPVHHQLLKFTQTHVH